MEIVFGDVDLQLGFTSTIFAFKNNYFVTKKSIEKIKLHKDTILKATESFLTLIKDRKTYSMINDMFLDYRNLIEEDQISDTDLSAIYTPLQLVMVRFFADMTGQKKDIVLASHTTKYAINSCTMGSIKQYVKHIEEAIDKIENSTDPYPIVYTSTSPMNLKLIWQ